MGNNGEPTRVALTAAPPTWFALHPNGVSSVYISNTQGDRADRGDEAALMRRRVCLFNMRGRLQRKLHETDFRAIFSDFVIVGLTETWEQGDFTFPGFETYAGPRKLNGIKKGGAALLLRRSLVQVAHPVQFRADKGCPPETVAVKIDGFVFGITNDVVIIVSYITKFSWESHQAYGFNLFEKLATFIIDLRAAGMQVLLMGDFNAQTMSQAGWTGEGAIFSPRGMSPGVRVSKCGRERIDAEGEALLALAEACELRIVNGWNDFDGSITRPDDGYSDGNAPGAVLDYFLATECVVARIRDMKVLEKTRHSDHRPLRLTLEGHTWNPRRPLPSSSEACRDADIASVVGWKFNGVPSEPRSKLQVMQDLAAIEISKHPDTRRIGHILETSGPNEAYRTIHRILRDAWRAAGARVTLTNGKAGEERLPDLPVETWFDEEAAGALKDWNVMRGMCKKRRNPCTALRERCSVARQRYRRLRAVKMVRWSKAWARFWADVKCNHVSVWKVISDIRGDKGGLQCACSMAQQRAHYAAVGQIRTLPSYDEAAARRASAWMDAFIREGRGVGEHPGLAEETVKSAFSRLRECAPSVDGLSKRWAVPLLTVLLPEVTALFSYIMFHGMCPEDWCLAVVASIKKKGEDLEDMDNFRGVHLLAFMRQWFATCILFELEILCARVLPIEQQGFWKGGRIYAAFLALYAMIEKARAADERLFVAFVDIRKAFPTVRRDLLFEKLSALGAPDSLIRSLWALYLGTKGSVRGTAGFGELFDILLGTREGGVESPLLYVLFAADLIPFLHKTQLRGEPARLTGRPTLALQLADDLALVARTAEDLQRLLDQWGRYCNLNHQETSIPKTEVAVYSTEDDAGCHGCGTPRQATARKHGAVAHSSIQLPGTKPSEPVELETTRVLQFIYQGQPLSIVDAFLYLGVLFRHDELATATYMLRAAAGTKAFGAIKHSIKAAPFLPFYRTVEMVECTTGGAYLYSAELWAPFLPVMGSVLGRQYSPWLLGFGRARISRTRGWFQLRELDVRAEAQAVRVIQDAHTHGGLLALAVGQFKETWESITNKKFRKEQLWYGRFIHMVRRIWPRFNVIIENKNVNWTGVSELNAYGTEPTLAKSYSEEVRRKRWRERQVNIFSSKPKLTQQDFVLAQVIRRRNGLDAAVGHYERGRAPTVQEKTTLRTAPIFLCRTTVSTTATRHLLRFLAGMEDFARCNGHFPRKHSHRIFLTKEHYKRLCLSCLIRRKVEVLDSEWHALFECPLNSAPRALFSYAYPLERFGFPSADALHSLVALVLQAHTDARLLDDFALWVVGTLACRRKEFRALSPS